MKRISFKILGNHKSKTGNAVPKLKMTGKQHWTPKAQEYVQWKAHVVRALIDTKGDPDFSYTTNLRAFGKPINTGANNYALMYIRVYWSNKVHGDPENIFGSIADALFVNDKQLDVVAVAEPTDLAIEGKPLGYVDVEIFIFESKEEKRKFIKKSVKIK